MGMRARPPGEGLVIALTALLAMTTPPARAADATTWASTDRWARWSTGRYTVHNNMWGRRPGPQRIWAASASYWGVRADHPARGGVKAYPNVSTHVGRRLSDLRALTSSYNVTVPDGGSYNTSYDLWDADRSHEIMLWVNRTADMRPVGTYQRTVTVGGHTWEVYRGEVQPVAGAEPHHVVSFLRTADSRFGTVDLKAVLDWVAFTARWMDDVVLGDVQFGFEIIASPGWREFRTNAWSVHDR